MELLEEIKTAADDLTADELEKVLPYIQTVKHRRTDNHSCAIRLYGRFQEVQTLMNEINRAAYITALQGLLVAATDAQLDTLWCMATKMILEQGETEQ